VKTKTTIGTFFRYPGAKRKAAKIIVPILKDFLATRGPDCEYREPFAGTAAIGLHLMMGDPRPRRAWLNDLDPAICCIWESVLRRPEELATSVGNLRPSVECYRQFDEHLSGLACTSDVADRGEVALRKIALQRMSSLGIGTKAGGPIGGWNQKGKNRVGDRYRPEVLARLIDDLSHILAPIRTHPDVCSCLDFEQILRAPGDAVTYLDPPYYLKGGGLYQFAFGEDDHHRLSDVLRHEARPWLLSYDVNPTITELYRGWTYMVEVPFKYSIKGPVETTEYLISNMPLAQPLSGEAPDPAQEFGGNPVPRQSDSRQL
jgi:DNA adenine methylase